MKVQLLEPEYVGHIPRELVEGVLYISKRFGTASHLCCCGCGVKIVTPLRETEYRLVEDGECVSLFPSIGNWDHPCESHYWIRNNRVVPAGRMTRAQIRRGRAHDDALKAEYFGQPARSWIGQVLQHIARGLRRLFE